MNSIPQNPNDYVPLGGTSRRYLNRVTGETISRRQYEKLFPPYSVLPAHTRMGDSDVYAVPKSRTARERLLRTLQHHGYVGIRGTYVGTVSTNRASAGWNDLQQPLHYLSQEYFDEDFIYSDEDEAFAPDELAYFFVH